MYLDKLMHVHTLTLNSIWLTLIILKVNLKWSKNSLKFCALKCTLLFMILSCLFLCSYRCVGDSDSLITHVQCFCHLFPYLSAHKCVLLLTYQLEIMTYILIKGTKIRC